MPPQLIERASALSRFSCLGERCEDTCCRGWGMQVDAPTRDRYAAQAPELLPALDTGEAEIIMRRDPATDHCVKFEDGLCGIHVRYGETFLGDACYFFPRATRRLGERVLVSATPSCPEIARLMLLADGATQYELAQAERLPYQVKDYLPEELSAEQAVEVHQAFLAAALRESQSPERAVACIASAAGSLAMLPVEEWPRAAPFFLTHAEGRLPPAEPVAEDPFNLLHLLCGVTVGARKTGYTRLMDTVRDIERMLGATLDWQQVAITTSDESFSRWTQAQSRWQEGQAPRYAVFLRRWVAMQVSLTLFPFSGLGEGIAERATLLGVRFALARLALIAAAHASPEGVLEEFHAIRAVQSLSRLFDHLASPFLLLSVCRETGWEREPRLRALAGDC